MKNKMQSIEQVEFLSSVLTEQTEEVLKVLGKEIDFDCYYSEVISSVLLCEGKLKFIYESLPAIVFSVEILEEALLTGDITKSSLFAVGMNLIEGVIKIKAIFEKPNGKLFRLYFDAKDVCVENIR